MNSQDESFNFSDFVKSMNENNVKYQFVSILFLLIFLLFIFISPKFINYIISASPLKIDFLISNPFEIVLNYCKISFFMALSFVLPIAIFQLGKLKIDYSDDEDKRTAYIYAGFLYFILFCAFFFTIQILLPAEIMLLYGFNFLGIDNASSFTSFSSLFFTDYIFSALLFSVPLMSKYSLNLPILDYKDFEKYQMPIYYTFGGLAILLVLPFELIACGLVFLMFCFFYRLAYKFAKRNKDE